LTQLGELSLAVPLAALCVIVAGFCSGTEVALFSLRRVDREQLARSETRRDRRVVAVLERPRRLIATVLIGHEACAAVLAILAVVVVARRIAVDSAWVIVALALVVTLPLVVMLGEVTAKTLAAKVPLAWSRSAALPLIALTAIVTPLRVIVSALAELLLRPLGATARTRPVRDLSEQEFRSLVDAGSAQGQVDARERRLIHRVFEFSDKNVGQVMTPRERIFGLSYDLPMQRLIRELAQRGFSRVPIYQKSLDNVRGIVNVKDLMRAAAGQPVTKPLGELLHEPLFVPRTTPVKRLFLTFKQKKVHMAIVVSEYGKVLGLVTMDDLLGLIFGVMRDERADLQASMPGIRVRARTPEPGVPIVAGPDSEPRPSSEPGSVRSSDGVPTRASSDVSGVIAEPVEGLDPPAVRPIHSPEEVTPPAIELDELQRLRETKR
jgi:magnesium and cobalt exporter, CNNM family